MVAALTTIPQNSFVYRMGAGFPGDVNRAHPANVEPVLNDSVNPVLQPGLGCILNASSTGVRSMAAGDTGITKIYGVSVRSFPSQDPGVNDNQFGGIGQGSAGLPVGSAIDVMRSGYINAYIAGAVLKGGAVWLWIAASFGAHIQGGFEAGASGGSTVALTNAMFNGPSDLSQSAGAAGYGEIIVDFPLS